MASIDFTSKTVPYGLKYLSGGLNSTDNPLSLDDAEASDLQNVDFNVNRSFKKRNGYTTLNSSAFNSGATATSLHWYETSSSDFLMGTFGNKVAKMDDFDGTWDDITEDQSVTFTGSGLDDATSGGTYTGNGDIEYKVVIDATGTPDTFEWFKDSVSQASGVSITGSAQTLDNGLTITFAATTGHTTNDQWVFHPATTITAGNNNLFKWSTFNGKAYGTNGVDRPIKWAGSGNASLWTVLSGMTKAKWCEYFENYMFVANVTVSSTVHQTRIYWSTLDDAETYSSADFNEIGLDDGQEITGLKALGDRLVVFKERSIYIALFTGDADIPFAFKKSQSSVGCVSGYSIQEVNNGLIFLSLDGIYFFDGATSTKISDRISSTINGYTKSRFATAVSGYQRDANRYWLSFTASGGSTHSAIVTWDSFNNAFSVYSGIAANAITVLRTSGDERIYFGDYGGFAYRADSGTSDNPLGTETAVTAYWRSKWFDFGDPMNQKGVPNVTAYFNYASTTMTFIYSYDLESGDQFSQTFSIQAPGSLWDQANWDEGEWGGSGGSFVRLDLDGRGRLIRFAFYNDVLDEQFQINGIGMNAHLETAA